MAVYQRPIRPDELMHASHKYKDKVRTKNGNWRYIYDDTYNNEMRSGTYYTDSDKGIKARTRTRDVQERYKNRSTEDRQERNYHGDRGIERHNSALFQRDLFGANRKFVNDSYDEYGKRIGNDSYTRRNRAAKAYKARQEQAAKQEAAKKASSPIHKTISAAQNTINKGKNLFKKLFG